MNDLNKKWWFRLVTVFYILVGVSSFGMLVYTTIEDVPTFSPYLSTFSYKCDDGYIGGKYKYGSDSSDIKSAEYNPTKDSLFYIENNFSIKLIKSTCANVEYSRDGLNITYFNNLKDGKYDQYIPKNDNFKIVVSDAKYWGTWKETILNSLLGLGILCISLFTTRYIFFYVLTGKHKLVFNEKRKN